MYTFEHRSNFEQAQAAKERGEEFDRRRIALLEDLGHDPSVDEMIWSINEAARQMDPEKISGELTCEMDE
jgi:hypothetical protein